MGTDDFDRLLGDLRKDSGMRSELEVLSDDPQAWVRWGVSHGYTLSAESLARLDEIHGDELSDDDLEKVAGGWCGDETTTG
ncbi:MAG TPA: Nif11-like leader peptide family RiPP precursor [Thermoanaerobaculia bacterium]